MRNWIKENMPTTYASCVRLRTSWLTYRAIVHANKCALCLIKANQFDVAIQAIDVMEAVRIGNER